MNCVDFYGDAYKFEIVSRILGENLNCLVAIQFLGNRLESRGCAAAAGSIRARY